MEELPDKLVKNIQKSRDLGKILSSFIDYIDKCPDEASIPSPVLNLVIFEKLKFLKSLVIHLRHGRINLEIKTSFDQYKAIEYHPQYLI